MRMIDADAFKEYICNAYEQVKHMYPDGGEWARQITEDFCKDIDDQPTIEPQKWVSCSERLPEENDEVLVTGKVDNALYVDIDEWTGSGFWINAFGVIAWMPLPEPYKGGEE